MVSFWKFIHLFILLYYITEEIIARKLARSLSQLSDKDTDQEALKEMIEREVTIRKSLKRIKSAGPTKRQISSPGTGNQQSQVICFWTLCFLMLFIVNDN